MSVVHVADRTRKPIHSAIGARFPSLTWGAVLTVIALGLFVPAIVTDSFFLGLLVNWTILAIAGISVGFLANQCGMVMFGVAGLTGGASYLFAIAVTFFGWSSNVAAATAVLGTTGIATFLGLLIVRAPPLAFAMLTLALAQMLRQAVLITDFRPVTGGDDGLGVNLNGTLLGLGPRQLANPSTFWVISWLSMCGSLLLLWCVNRSRFGKILRAIKLNEERMRFCGFDTFGPRLVAFALGSFIASIAGLLAAINAKFVSPELLDFTTGADALVATMIGGVSSIFGPVLGSFVFVLGRDQFGASGHLELFTGLALVVLLFVFPNGLMGLLAFCQGRLLRKQKERVDAGR